MTIATAQPAAAFDRGAALSADAFYAAAIAAAKQARQAASTARCKAITAIRSINYLVLASEATSRQMWAIESLPDDRSKAVEETTGDCADCWFQTWSQAEDATMNAAMDCALKAALAVRAYRRALAEVEAAQAAIDPVREAALARIDKAAA